MSNNIFLTQITILGFIDYLSDLLENNTDRKEFKENLLAAIQATFTNKILENNEASETFKSMVSNIPDGQDSRITLENMQKLLESKPVNIDVLPVLKESAKEVLSDFVTKSEKHQIIEQIDGIFQ